MEKNLNARGIELRREEKLKCKIQRLNMGFIIHVLIQGIWFINCLFYFIFLSFHRMN